MKKLIALALLVVSQAVMAQSAPVIGDLNNINSKVGEYYYASVEISNANWVDVAGLPDGLWYDYWYDYYGSGIDIIGVPTAKGTYNIIVTAEGNTNSTRTFTITIAPPDAPQIYDWRIEEYATAGDSYSGQIYSSSWAEWSISSGSLPSGISLESNGSYAYIEGRPEHSGTYTFTVIAANESGSTTKQFTIYVEAPNSVPTIQARNLGKVEVGVNYYFYINAEYWAELSIVGSLPPGLELINGYIIGGRPTKAGTYNFTVKATNEKGNATQAFSIVIEAAKTPTILTTTLPNGELGKYYLGELESASGAAEWSITIGKLPDGLELHRWGDGSASIEGYPEKKGSFTFTVKTQNTAGSATKSFTIAVTDAKPPVITTPDSLDGELGGFYELWFKANEYVRWEYVSGDLPEGLRVENCYYCGIINGDYIEGAPLETGSFEFTMKATNNVGLSATKTFTLVISEPKAPTISSQTMPICEIGYSCLAEFESASASAEFSITSGNLPPGMELKEYHGNVYYVSGKARISGEPEAAGKYTFTLTATNYAGVSDSKTFTIEVFAAPQKPAFITTTLPNGNAYEYYSEYIFSTSPSAMLSIVSGNLPANFSFSNSYGEGKAAIDGTFKTAGTYKFKVRAENAAGFAEKEFTITVKGENAQTPPAVIIPQPPKDGNSDDDDTPILPQVAFGSVGMLVSGKTITLTNLPANAKVSVYNLQGKQIYTSAGAQPATSLQIPIQATGMYIVKAGAQSFRAVVR